jgi:adenosine deaminase
VADAQVISVTNSAEQRRDLAALPKAHLHLHLDGSMRRGTLAELAEARGLDAPLPNAFGSFSAFGATIEAAARVLDEPGVVERVVDEVAADAAHEGVVWVDLSVWPGLFRGRLGSDLESLDVVLEAAAGAATAHGVGFGLVVAANRDRGPQEAVAAAELAAEYSRHGVTGFGLDGDEAAHPPDQFATAFAVAREAGLQCVPHAGELAGPASVADALDVLHADRIMHGVRAIEDPRLVRRLVESDVCLDVCPTSNVMLSVAPSLAEHPLPRFLAARVPCSVNADDPLLFDTSILREYQLCRDALGLSDEQLAEVARSSLRGSSAPSTLTATALAAVDAWLAGPIAEGGPSAG